MSCLNIRLEKKQKGWQTISIRALINVNQIQLHTMGAIIKVFFSF